ncbi:hypothetical protein AB0G74_08695 [Streptomyces sp. NPDC020875]|uniref:hypothetical protein n=1 Tax=Streptomyces sp. NPDC020875 TaxID=3154898 RepID=UPI0033F8070B
MKREVEVGRWTFCTWEEAPGMWFAVGWTRGSAERPYPVGGPALTVGRRTWAVCARYSRAGYRAAREDPWAAEEEVFRPLPRRRRGLARLLWW